MTKLDTNKLDMTQLDPLDRQLALIRAATVPPDAAKARIRGALGRANPAGVSGNVSANISPAARAATRGGAVWKALGLLGAGLVAGYWLGVERGGARSSSSPADDRSLGVALAPARDEPVTGGRALAPAESTAPAAVESPAHEPAAPASARAATPLPRARGGAVAPRAPAAELSLLARAERAIRAGEGALALALVAELERSHPRTRLGEERKALRVLAECLLGDRSARAGAAAFLEAHPSSVYSDRVRRLCLSESSPVQDGSDRAAH